jgi:hypothetical protein
VHEMALLSYSLTRGAVVYCFGTPGGEVEKQYAQKRNRVDFSQLSVIALNA